MKLFQKLAVVIPLSLASLGTVSVPTIAAVAGETRPPVNQTLLAQYISRTDIEFLRLLLAFTEESSALGNTSRQVIYTMVKESPSTTIDMAKSVCYGLQGGLSIEEIAEAQLNAVAQTVSNAGDRYVLAEAIATIDAVGIGYYCPAYLR